MENLFEILNQFEMKFNEGKLICFGEFVGEEHDDKNFRQLVNMCGLEDHLDALADLRISRDCFAFFDDGWFHLKINRDLLTEEFINEIDFD